MSINAPAELRRFPGLVDDGLANSIREAEEAKWPEAVIEGLKRAASGPDGKLQFTRGSYQALTYASRMINTGYTLRDHPAEQFIVDQLLELIVSEEAFTLHPTLHRWACTIFSGHATTDRPETWHYLTPRKPRIPWRPLRDFIDRLLVSPRMALVNNPGFASRRSALMSVMRNVVLESRLLFDEKAFAEIWHDSKCRIEVHSNFGWPAVGFFLPTARLFGNDPQFPCDDGVFAAQLEAVREIFALAVGTAHWSSSSGTPNYGMLRLIRRLWTAYLQAVPSDAERQKQLDAVFDRARIVPFIFHITFLSLRVPIATPDEHQAPANVDDDRLYFGDSKGTVRGEAAECLAAFVPADGGDKDDVFWPLFEQLVRTAEVHAGSASTRRSSYASSFLSVFMDKVMRRVKGETAAHRPSVNPRLRISLPVVKRLTELVQPLAMQNVLAAGSNHSVPILGCCTFFRPSATTAEIIVSTIKLGLKASNEAHQIHRSVELLARVASTLWCGPLARTDSAVFHDADVAGARSVMRAAMPSLIPDLVLGIDSNDMSKLLSCTSGLLRLIVCARSMPGGVCNGSVLGMGSDEFAQALVARLVSVIDALPKPSKQTWGETKRFGTILSANLAVILNCVVGSRDDEDNLTRTIDAAFKIVPAEKAEVAALFFLATGVVAGGNIARRLLPAFLERANPAHHKEEHARDHAVLATALLYCGPSDAALKARDVFEETTAAWDALIEGKEHKGRTWTRNVQMRGKLLRAYLAGLLNERLEGVRSSTAGHDAESPTAELRSIFPCMEDMEIKVHHASSECVDAARELLSRHLAAPTAKLNDFLHSAAEDQRTFDEPARWELLRAVLTMRYICTGNARRLMRGWRAHPQAPAYNAQQAEGELWTPAADPAPWSVLWHKPQLACDPFGPYPGEPIAYSLEGCAQLLLNAGDRIADKALAMLPVDAITIKLVKVLTKAVCVAVGRKSALPRKLQSFAQEVTTALSDSHLTPDSVHFPEMYFAARARINRYARLGETITPADTLPVIDGIFDLTAKLSLAASSNVRAVAQQLYSDALDKVMGILGPESADIFLARRMTPLRDDPKSYATRPDHEITGLFWVAHDASRVLWATDQAVEYTAEIAKLLMCAPEFKAPSNENRRSNFFASVKNALVAVAGRPATLRAAMEHIYPLVAAESPATVTLARFCAAVESALPDCDANNAARRKTPCSAHGPAVGADALANLPDAFFQLILHQSADLTASTTNAPGVLLQLLMLAVPRRDSRWIDADRLDPKTNRVEIDGKTFEAAPNHLKPRLMPARRVKVHLIDSEDAAKQLQPTPAQRRVGDFMWSTMAVRSQEQHAEAGQPAKWTPLPWLRDFFELGVSSEVQTFDTQHVFVWKMMIQAAALSTELNGWRGEPVALVLSLGMANIEAATSGAQTRELTYRCITGLHAVSGAFRACKSMPSSAPSRREVFDALSRIAAAVCSSSNVSQEVIEAVEDALVYAVKTMAVDELQALSSSLATTAVETSDTNSQCAVRAITLLAALGLLGLSGAQYRPVLESMASVIRIVHRCNHHMRVAIIPLVYRFFYVVAFLDITWLVSDDARPFLADLPAEHRDLRVVNVSLEDVQAVLALRDRVWDELVAPLRLIPDSTNDETDVEVPKETLIVAKVFAASMSGSQSVVTWGREAETLQLLLKVTACSVSDGDDLRDLVSDAAWALAFQRHSPAGVCALATAASQALGRRSLHKRGKEMAAFVARVVGYLNQYQWPTPQDHEVYGVKLLNACMANFDHTYTPLRTEVRSTFAVFCRLLRRDVVKKFAMRAKKVVDGSPEASNEDVSMAAAIASSCTIARAFPECVPSFMPKLLVRLAKWSTLPQDRFLSNAAHSSTVAETKDCLKAWWQAHRDEWHYRHEQEFTRDQIDTLMDHFQSNSYYV